MGMSRALRSRWCPNRVDLNPYHAPDGNHVGHNIQSTILEAANGGRDRYIVRCASSAKEGLRVSYPQIQ